MILTKELTYTVNEIETKSPCTEAGDGYIYMQGTEVQSEIQYMGAVYVLRGCYDLLRQAGFNVLKDESDQSLTIWGLKLKFATISKNRVNINAPDINYTFNISMRSDNTTFTKTNYFLQRSTVTKTGLGGSNYSTLFGTEGTGENTKLGYYNAMHLTSHTYTEDDINKATIFLTLYCSSDGIQICYKNWKKDTDKYSELLPFLSIYKGKNILNNKDILVVGQMLEKAPFAFDYNVNQMFVTSTSYHKYYVTASYGDGASTQYNGRYFWHPFASSYVCSGSNIIYEYDEENSKCTKTNETLYLDSEGYMGDTKISLQLLDGVATGNFGKYEIYGIAKLKDKLIGFIPNSFYQINDKKYWCRHGNLQSVDINANTKIKYDIDSDTIDVSTFSNGKYGYMLKTNSVYAAVLLLKSRYNSFGCGVIVPPTTKTEYNNLLDSNPYFSTHSECKPNPECLNPYILLRIDDEIVDDTEE